MLFSRNRKDHRKIFAIGRNKTGTTSIGRALSDLGYRLGSQREAERLIEDWAQRKFHSIVDFCKTADAFQDAPFSYDYTYQAMDYAFPGSRFILTVRKDGEEWYESVTRFHTKLVGKGRLPTPDDLKQFPLNGKGWLWRTQQVIYGINERTLYDKELYIRHYEMHNMRVKDYFRYRQDDLLVLNLSDPDSMDVLCRFLGKPVSRKRMPHLNRSAT